MHWKHLLLYTTGTANGKTKSLDTMQASGPTPASASYFRANKELSLLCVNSVSGIYK